MPGKQTAQARNQAPSAPARGRAAPLSSAVDAAAATGERDEHYALISTLYHALQGAETTAQYLRDAREADDEELASFFEETREAYVEQANEAKRLLASRLEDAEGDEDDVEDEEDEDEEEEEEEE